MPVPTDPDRVAASEPEVTITMTEDLALPAKVALTMMGTSIERKRKVLELRAERDRLQEQLGRVEAALKVEEGELAQEHEIVGELVDQWEKIVETKFIAVRKEAERGD